MTLLSLVRHGYGTFSELSELDTPEFLDIVEFHQMSSAIERYEYEQARNGNG